MPAFTSLMFSLATDDVMVFSSAGPGGTSEATRNIEIEMAAAGIAKHPGKDEDDVLSGVCVGVELVDGTWWWPPVPRMRTLLMAVSWVCGTGVASPAGILAMLGVLQWFDLMRRRTLSCYHSVYAFVAGWNDWTRRPLPASVREELLTSILFSTFWGIDMSLPHLPFIDATDASDEFGIGGCTTPASDYYVRFLARMAERDSTYVTIRDIEPKLRSRPFGEPINISKRVSDFTSIFCIKFMTTDTFVSEKLVRLSTI